MKIRKRMHKDESLSGFSQFIVSILLWGWVIFFTFMFFFVDLLVFFPLSIFLDKGTGGMTHLASRWWGWLIIFTSMIWRLDVRGRHHIDPKKQYVIIANHQSLLDILVVAATLPINFKFLAKKELFYIPIMGWAMALAGYIPVDRSSHESGKRAVLWISRYLKKGASVLLFPEGTRSHDGKVHAFKMGAFKLSRETQCPILPVVIEGTGQALPKRSFYIRKKSTFAVSIGKPVDLSDLGDQSLEDAKEQIRHEMIGRLERIRHQRDR